MRWVGALRDAHLDAASLGLALVWSLSPSARRSGGFSLLSRAGYPLPPVTFVAVVGLSSLAGLLSISGIGTRDWALIALLGREHIGHETALAASFLILFLNLTNIVPGLIAWYRDPVPLRRRPPPADAGDLRSAAGVVS